MQRTDEIRQFQNCYSFTWETDIRKHTAREYNFECFNFIFELRPRQSKVYIFLYEKFPLNATVGIETYVFNKEEQRTFQKSYRGPLKYGPTIWSEKLCELEKVNACVSGKVKFGFKFSQASGVQIGERSIPSARCANNNAEASIQQETRNLSLEKMSFDFSKLFDNEEGSDVTIKGADRQFKAHRCILSTRSDVFAAMLRSEMKESMEGIITIEWMAPNTLEQMLRYIYSGKVEGLTVETASELYKVAVYYGVGSLKDHCASILRENLCQIYACDVLLLADTYTDEQLKNSTMDFMVETDALLRTDQWHMFCAEHHSLGLKVYQKYACKQIRQRRAEQAGGIGIEDLQPSIYLNSNLRTVPDCAREIGEVLPTHEFRRQPAQSTSRFGGETLQHASGSEGQTAVASVAPCSTLNFTQNASKGINAEEKDPSSLENIPLDFSKLFDSKQASDVVLKCVDRQFKAHVRILSDSSDVFAAIIRSNMLENNQEDVTIEDVDPETLERMLRYIYSGTVEGLTVETALGLYKAARDYEMQPLNRRCASFLKENLSQTSACGVLVLANTYGDEQLEKSVVDFMIQNKELFCTDQWDEFCDEHPSLGIKVYRKYLDKEPTVLCWPESGLIFKQY